MGTVEQETTKHNLVLLVHVGLREWGSLNYSTSKAILEDILEDLKFKQATHLFSHCLKWLERMKRAERKVTAIACQRVPLNLKVTSHNTWLTLLNRRHRDLKQENSVTLTKARMSSMWWVIGFFTRSISTNRLDQNHISNHQSIGSKSHIQRTLDLWYVARKKSWIEPWNKAQNSTAVSLHAL